MSLPVRRRNTMDPAISNGWRPFDPFADFDRMYERMGQLIRGLVPEIDVGSWSLPVDIEESDDAYVVEIDLPGVRRDDLTLDWDGRELTLHGEVKERERTGMLRWQTRRTGRFDYTVTLPGEVDADKIDARLVDGVLTIRAPKAESAWLRRIEITS